MEDVILTKKSIESLDRLVDDFRNGDISDTTDLYTAKWWIGYRQTLGYTTIAQ